MLVNCVLLLTACFSSVVVTCYGRTDNEYADLLNLLYERYKLYKRDRDSLDEYMHLNDYKKKDIPAVKKENIYIKQDVNNKYEKDDSSTKRSNVVAFHVVTPVHDDDIDVDDAEKRGLTEALPKMDIITPIHDDEEDATQKHIVPVHDDDIDVATNRHKAPNTNLPDDSKTFITVVEKNGKTAKDASLLNKGVNVIDDSDDDDEDNGKGNDIFDSEGTFHINNVNNDKEENVLEVDAGGDKDLVSEAEENAEEIDEEPKPHVIQMPKVAPKVMDTYLCYAHKLPTDDRYIVEYQPLAEKQIAHHMLLFGCRDPFQETGVWSCREMSPVCKGGGQSIMYAWAKNAPALKMPTNVGFHVGGQSGFHYLVLQVHYLHVDKFKSGNRTDNSGIRFFLDKMKKRYLAGIYLLANGFTPIPPHKKKAYIDMGCFYPEGPKFFPFRFRVHAHKLGVVVTGYRVREGKWTLIGRGDPQRPQAFYSVFHDIDVRPGDTIMGRCTYNSTSRDRMTYIGATHADEMCNFYTMYFYDSRQYYGGPGEFPCADVVSRPGSLFDEFPDDSDISLATMEEANRINFAKHGLKDMAYVEDRDWPVDGMKDGDVPLTVGQISGVDMTKDQSQVVIVHRAQRIWGSTTFDGNNKLKEKKYQEPIPENTLIWLSRGTGAIKKADGKNMFYMPHGITIDDDDNIWITDVGAHQVYKLAPNMDTLLELGQRFVPGSGNKHFCKPTDVAVMENGDFYVADGYCNNRVVKFNSEGKMLLQISADKKPNIGIFPSPKSMSVVHSLSLDRVGKRLFVADRENGRILIFHSTNGTYISEIKVVVGAVYAVAYNLNQGGVLHFVTGPLSDQPVTISGYTYSFVSNSIVSKWVPDGGFSLPHDLSVSDDNQNTFVAEINPYKIWKFTRKMKTRP